MANEDKKVETAKVEQDPKGTAQAAALPSQGGSKLAALLEKAETRIEVLVLGVEKWEYADKGLKGCRVYWCELGAGEADSRRGWLPKLAKSSDYVNFDELKQFALPAYFSARQTVVKDGLELSDFRHVADLEAA